jgi:hypothetical protein
MLPSVFPVISMSPAETPDTALADALSPEAFGPLPEELLFT